MTGPRRAGRFDPRPTLILGAALLLLFGFVAFGVGLLVGRQALAGGILSDLARTATVVIGLAGTVVIVARAVANRRRDRRRAALFVAVLAIGWSGWIAGNAVATAQGPGVEYAGTATFTVDGKVVGSERVLCSSVVGDPMQLAEVNVQTNGFDLVLRNRVDRSSNPTVWSFDGEALLGGVVVLGSVDHVADEGLSGEATVSSVFTPTGGSGAPVVVTLVWTCNPATKSPS